MANKGAVDGVSGENGSRTVSTALGAGSHSSIPAIQPADSPMCFVELAKGIEPSTCGLQISHGGVAQVFGDMGNLLSHSGNRVEWAVGRACFSLSLGEGVCLAA